ncbi:MAG: two-component regulator propeller domain-containing protein [Gemmatimonadaceae bacterium]
MNRHVATRHSRITRILASLTLPLGLAFAVMANATDADAQLVNFRQYTSGDGMPRSEVLGLQQDHLGYMWFATLSGLSRFNGRDFHNYARDDGLSSNAVFDVVEDSRGRMVAATSGGLCVLDKGLFRCYRKADGLSNEDTRTLAADSSGGVWAGTNSGLSYLLDGVVRNFHVSDGLPAERIAGVAVDSAGVAWVATSKGLARFDGKRFRLESPESIGQGPVQFVTATGHGLLVGAAGRVFMRSGTEFTRIAAEGIPDSTVLTDGTTDREGTIWLATRKGALRIRNGHVDQLGRVNGMQTELINRVTVDREGDIWFGTEGGASKHVPGPFRTYTPSAGLPNQFVRALELDRNGELWVGTRSGIAKRVGERFVTVPLPGAPDDRVFSLAHTAGGGLLIGTRRGLAFYEHGRLRQVYLAKDGLPSDVVYSLVDNGHGGVWIGTDRGLAQWQDGKVTTISRPELTDAGIITMRVDLRGRLWIGRLRGGITILDGDSVRNLGLAQGATDQTIWSLKEDAKGALWAGTNGDGALRIDDAGIKQFTVKDGLSSNSMWQVLVDSHGDVWLYGNRGLDRVSGTKITHYGRGNGLTELEGSINAAVEDREGNLWFGTGGGIVRYEPGLDITPAVAPPVYIEETLRDGMSFPAATSTEGARLGKGVIQLRFSAPSFRDESAVRFKYRLIGATNSWSTATAEQSITYAELNPGSYRFEVMSVNGAMQSATSASVAFVVTPAFWQSWWFRLLALALVVGATATVPFLRTRALERERERLEGLVAQHTHELADKNQRLEQSNRDLEHFAYIASHDLQEPLRKIQAFSDRVTKLYSLRLDEQGRDYLSRMGAAAARMQRLIDDLLSLSRVTTKRNAVESIELDALAHEVLGDLEFRLQSTNGRVELTNLPRIEGDPVQIRQVFQNLIGNALKFHRPGESPVVRVSATQRDARMIELRFEDNGIGFENKDAERVFLPFQRLHGRSTFEGTGIGLTICQKIAERHGGSIRAESIVGTGSRFIVTLPVNGPLGEHRNAA